MIKLRLIILASFFFYACSQKEMVADTSDRNASDRNASDRNASVRNATSSDQGIETQKHKSERGLELSTYLILFFIFLTNLILWKIYDDFKRWKERSPDGKHFIMVPDKVQDYLEDSEGSFATLSDKIIELDQRLSVLAQQITGQVDQNKKSVEHSINEFEQHLEAVKGLAEERKKEVERYRQGFEKDGQKQVIRELIDSLDIADAYIHQLNDAGQTDDQGLEGLEFIQEKMLIILEDHNIEKLCPVVGAAVDDDSLTGKIKIVGTRTAELKEQVGTVAKVNAPCYFKNISESESVTLRPALVVAFKERPEDVEDESEETGENTQDIGKKNI